MHSLEGLNCLDATVGVLFSKLFFTLKLIRGSPVPAPPAVSASVSGFGFACFPSFLCQLGICLLFLSVVEEWPSCLLL